MLLSRFDLKTTKVDTLVSLRLKKVIRKVLELGG